MKRIVLALMAMLFLAQTASMAVAADSGPIRELSVYPFIQYFTWEEFSPEGRLLKESGPQFGVGGDILLYLVEGDAGAMTFRGKVELFGGEVDYDGQLQDGTPHSTDVTYFGTNEQVALGWAIPYRDLTIEPFGGLGYRWWLRDLQGSGGYTEYWTSLSALLGMRGNYKLGPETSLFAMGGGKYPFYNRNDVENYPGVGRIELEPGSEWSAMAEGGVRYRQMKVSFYYESFIFARSPIVTEYDAYRQPTPGPSDFVQPRSESEIFGLKFGWSFR